MEKPIIVAAEETKEAIKNIIGSSGVPMYMMKSIVSDILKEVEHAAAQELAYARQVWSSEQSKEEPTYDEQSRDETEYNAGE